MSGTCDAWSCGSHLIAMREVSQGQTATPKLRPARQSAGEALVLDDNLSVPTSGFPVREPNHDEKINMLGLPRCAQKQPLVLAAIPWTQVLKC